MSKQAKTKIYLLKISVELNCTFYLHYFSDIWPVIIVLFLQDINIFTKTSKVSKLPETKKYRKEKTIS